MFSMKNIISAAALSAALVAGHAGASLAGETQMQTLKPLQAVTFNAGEKTGVGYFYDEAGSCKLVLTLAEAADHFAATRYEAIVPAGQHGHYANGGRSFEFACQGQAIAMTFKQLDTVASIEKN